MIETIDDLAPNPSNPRTIQAKAKKGLRKSMEKFGDLSGITYNKRTQRLVCGHQRVSQLKKIGGVFHDGAILVKKGDDHERFPVRIVDWDEDLEHQANVAANNPTIQGEWSDDIESFLRDIRLKLPEDEFSDLGFDSLADALKIDFDVAVDPVDPEMPPLPEDPVVQPGETWILGDHTLVCGDSTKPDPYPNKGVSLWITDPPYNVAYEGKTKDALTIQNDSMGDGQFRQFLVDAFRQAFDSMAPGAGFYIWHADSEGYNFRGAVHDVGEKVRQCLIWEKNCMVMGRQDYQWMHEPCLYGWKKGGAHGWYSDRKQTTILKFDRPSQNKEHPTMKPVKLFQYQITNSTPPGALVLDNFAGSGTTILACEQSGRKSHGIELDPRYCDVIIQRWEELSGGSAKKAG